MRQVETSVGEPRQGRAASERAVVGFRSVLQGRDFFLSARRLWLLSVALYRAGHPRLAGIVKNINSILYHNSLPAEVVLSPDITLGHHGIGTVVHPKVELGSKVKIFQNVTMAVRPPTGPGKIVIEDNAVVGANAVIMTPSNKSVRIGYGARVGAGSVVTHDVPPQMNAVSPAAELKPRRNHPQFSDVSPDL
jgi:serine O-acetyltransferase